MNVSCWEGWREKVDPLGDREEGLCASMRTVVCVLPLSSVLFRPEVGLSVLSCEGREVGRRGECPTSDFARRTTGPGTRFFYRVLCLSRQRIRRLPLPLHPMHAYTPWCATTTLTSHRTSSQKGSEHTQIVHVLSQSSVFRPKNSCFDFS